MLFVACILHDVWQAGKDDRFDLVRNNKFRFFTFWHIQGVWVFITTMPVHVCNFVRERPPAWNFVDSIGLALWVIGFAVEVIADQQKSAFRTQNRDSKDPKWICSGLWA
jgi:steroid 5-alpha reductase family enzyme